jgi:RNA-directed DNA polymerase
MKGWEATTEGTPQGGVVSPLLANIYLDGLDWLIAGAGLQMVRYADATQRGGFEFLGYHFERGQKWPRKKSEVKVREKLRAWTRRTNGQSLQCIIAGINPILRGWFNYFRYSKRNALQAMDGWIRGRLRSILRKRAKRKGKARGINDHTKWRNRFFDEAGLFNLTGSSSKRPIAPESIIQPRRPQSHCRPYQLESRMLENCLSGSEGGGAVALPTPIIAFRNVE